jgi:hypothetical protein
VTVSIRAVATDDVPALVRHILDPQHEPVTAADEGVT